MRVSERSQVALVWWSVVFILMYAVCMIFLLQVMPPQSAKLSPVEIQAWYRAHDSSIKTGAAIASYCSAFMVPFWVVMGMQIARHEKGRPVWATLAVTGGSLISIFLVLPPILFGVAAYNPTMDADIVHMLHALGMLCLITTAQFYIFGWVAIIAASFVLPPVENSPFSRPYGYLNIFLAIFFEVASLPWFFKDGMFAWGGLFPFWMPWTFFGSWLALTVYLLLNALKKQSMEPEHSGHGELGPTPVASEAPVGTPN